MKKLWYWIQRKPRWLIAAVGVDGVLIYGVADALATDKFLGGEPVIWVLAASANSIPIALYLAGRDLMRTRSEPPEDPSSEVPPDTGTVSVSRLPRTGAEFVGRDDELKVLDEAWDGGGTNVVEIVAWGGTGKSALVNRWRGQMAVANYRGAEKVYGWSFYSQGTSDSASSDQFINHALEWFRDSDPTQGSPWDKGDRLARLVNDQRTLLLLDGLEPLQDGGGMVRDPAVQSLLRGLEGSNRGLCVVTTRVRVTDLDGTLGTVVKLLSLDRLSAEAGTQLLRDLGIKGDGSELNEAVEEFRGHALALSLLGSLLRDGFGGNIRHWRDVPPLEVEEERGPHARGVMESYVNWFRADQASSGRGMVARLLRRAGPSSAGDPPEVAILRMLGLFNRPADGPAIDSLRQLPVISGLTEPIVEIDEAQWGATVTRLRRAGLVAQADASQPGALDAHPLVREHFGEWLKGENAEAWREANGRLYEHYRDTAKPLPDTIEELQPLYHAVAHGCAARRYQEALDDVYYARIHRADWHFSLRMLGAFGAELVVLSGFFNSPWREPVPDLSAAAQSHMLHEAGFALKSIARSGDAIETTLAGLEAEEARMDWRNATSSATNLSSLYSQIGDLRGAFRMAEHGVKRADDSEDQFHRMGAWAIVGKALHQLGKFDEAAVAFEKAEAIQRKRQPEYPLLYSLQGFFYLGLLSTMGHHKEVLKRSTETLQWAEDASLDLLSIAADHLSLGRAFFMNEEAEGGGNYSPGAEHLDEAVEGLRNAGQRDMIPLGLLARAELRRVTEEYGGARRDLDEAMTIAERGGMRLHEADGHLGYARLAVAEGERAVARRQLDTAKVMIEEMEYHQRDPEVAELEAELAGDGVGE